ncbi:MAG: phosphoribosyl 1,2-cyclic phosphodiesterase [Candidatus Azotimanducaceae bacterium]|jgi:phosphoribosyl 1,2-cyclic phosphodiesterase
MTIENMRIRLYGVQGSGFRICAGDVAAKWGMAEERNLYIFGSHAHFDHTEGFDQAAVCFDPRNNIHILANHHYLKGHSNTTQL